MKEVDAAVRTAASLIYPELAGSARCNRNMYRYGYQGLRPNTRTGSLELVVRIQSHGRSGAAKRHHLRADFHDIQSSAFRLQAQSTRCSNGVQDHAISLAIANIVRKVLVELVVDIQVLNLELQISKVFSRSEASRT